MSAVKVPGWVKYAAKAITATAVAVVGVVSSAATDGHITAAEWLVAVGAGLTALGAVFGIGNADAP